MNFAPLYKVRPILHLKDMIEQNAKLYGNKDAFLVKNSSGMYEGISYSRFKGDIDALGTALNALGLKDRFIAVIGENRYEWCVTYLSVVNGLGVIVPLDKELPPKEIAYLLSRSNASAIIFSGKYGGEIKEICRFLKTVGYLINMDAESDEEGILSFRKLVERGNELIGNGDRSFVDAEVDREKMSILIFTSGTTGMAKGVMLSHKNVCSNITSVCSTIYVDSNDSSLSILPLHHTYECTLGFLTLMYIGGTISFNEGLKHVARNLKEVRPTLLIAVPLILENMYKKIWEQAAKKRGMTTKLKTAMAVSNLLLKAFKIDIRRSLFKQIHENIGGRVRLIVTGAAAVNPVVSKGFRTFGIPVLQGYGLTECAPLVTGNRDIDYRDDSIGVPVPGVDVRIDNPNEYGIGEVLVKGDNVMLGYYENDEATKACIKDGWLHTGDLGRMDKSGFLYITGRSKNVIVTKNGKNIYPEEVEAYINRSPFVLESMVWGRHDETSGETQVNAQIFPNLDAIKEKLKVANVSKDEIFRVIREVIKNVNSDMPLYKHIRNFSIRDNEFVKTTTRKIKRYMADVNKGGNTV